MKKKRKIANLLLFVFLLSPVFFIKANHETTVSYLQQQSQSSWTAQALSVVGADNIVTSFVDTQETDFMKSAKYLLALSSVNSDNSEGMQNFVDNINATFDGTQLGNNQQLNDDYWGLLALSSVNRNDNFSNIKNFIINNQNQDKGWGWAVGGTSDSNDTVVAIMALLETGLNNNSIEIINALEYLKLTQNDDGGFGYDIASVSDGASTSWILSALYKLGVDPSTWKKNNNDPVEFLNSLSQQDGSYLWLSTDTDGSSLVTPYALIALNQKYYPVNKMDLVEVNNNILVDVRIEKEDKTVCLAKSLEGLTVLDILEKASEVCGFNYIAEDTDFGKYISSIDDTNSEGLNGWLYWVNNQSAMVGPADYELGNNDSILWTYGAFGIMSTEISVNSTNIDVNGQLLVSVKYFDNNVETPLANTSVFVGDTSHVTDAQGNVLVSMTETGVYPVVLDYTGNYIRSNKIYVVVGQGESELIDLSVVVNNNNGSTGVLPVNNVVSFSLSKNNLDFGELNPNESSTQSFTLSNTGNTVLNITSEIVGDNLFINNTILDNQTWQNYSNQFSQNESKDINVTLSVPESYEESGQQQAQLIIWANVN